MIRYATNLADFDFGQLGDDGDTTEREWRKRLEAEAARQMSDAIDATVVLVDRVAPGLPKVPDDVEAEIWERVIVDWWANQ